MTCSRCVRCWRPSPPGWPLRGTEADFIMIRRRYDEMMAAQGSETDAATHAHLDHAFHRAICEASHNPVLVHTLQSLTDLLLGSVFACVNNLYHREPEKKLIDRQHARLYNAVIARQPSRPGAPPPSTWTACARAWRTSSRKSSAWCARRGGWRAGLRAGAWRVALRPAAFARRLTAAAWRCVATLDVSGRSIRRCPGPGACRHRRGQSGSAAGSPARSSPARQNRVAAARPASPGPAPRRCRRRSTAGWR